MAYWPWRRFSADSAPAVAILLTLIVALPAVGLLWLVSEAARNEHFAVRERLTSAYEDQLESLRRQVAADWQQSLERFGETIADESAGAAFASCARREDADGLIVLNADGQPAYPTLVPRRVAEAAPQSTEGLAAEWLVAERLEFAQHDYAAAAAAYEQIAKSTTDDNLAVRAIQSQARSLLRAGQDAAVVELLEAAIESPRLQRATGNDGRRIWIDLGLLLAERARDSNPAVAAAAADRVAAELNDYGEPLLESAQRRFAMHRLEVLFPGRLSFATLAAEDLSGEYLELPGRRASPRELENAGMADVWRIAVPADQPAVPYRAVALYRTSTITARLQDALDRQGSLTGVRLTALAPRANRVGEEEFLAVAVGPSLPGWTISLSLTGDDPFAESATGRRLVYIGTAVLTIVATACLALLAGIALRRQRRLARLKNELVATVSHELKTPLAGIRLLVDTLLAAEPPDPRQAPSYLQLIARETARLSRLVDSFLNFSRMERGQQQFALSLVTPDEVVQRAATAMQERLSELACRLELHCEPGLPTVRADGDALVTVLVNLLDNACKYGGDSKLVTLRAFAARERVSFAVTDRGIGLAARHRQRIFDRFYQVDQRLARPAGGCGLGLSIVQHIVAAHGGTIEVESQPGRGSTFTVALPVAEAPTTADRSDGLCTTS